ncbi:MAG: hypothetical protein ACJAUV_001866 [Flavobacteriales bacterium]|jgi:hypothetical protein
MPENIPLMLYQKHNSVKSSIQLDFFDKKKEIPKWKSLFLSMVCSSDCDQHARLQLQFQSFQLLLQLNHS